MESLFKNPIIRNLLAIALGVVIIINPQLGPNIVIMLIGATLAIPALLAIIGYFSYKNKETPMPGYVSGRKYRGSCHRRMDVTATDIFQCCYPDSLRYNTSPCRYFANHLSDTFGSNNAYPHRYVYCTGTDHDSGIPHDFQAFRNGKSHHDDIRYIDGDLRYIGYDTVLQIPTIIYKTHGAGIEIPAPCVL